MALFVLLAALAAAAAFVTCSAERGPAGSGSGGAVAGPAGTSRTTVDPETLRGSGPSPRKRKRAAEGRTPDACATDGGATDGDAGSVGAAGDASNFDVRVLWPDGTPAPGAVVMIGDIDGGDGGSGIAETSPGTFAGGDFTHYWHAEAAALRDGEAWLSRIEVDGPTMGSLRLRKADEWEATRFVRVVGPGGEPVREARVDVARGRPRWGFESHAWTGSGFGVANGRFAFQPWRWRDSPHSVVLVVHGAIGDDGTSFGAALVEFGSDDPIERTVRLPPGGAVRGRVVDADGAPVFRAEVSLDAPRPDGFDGDHMSSPSLTALTEEDGSFIFPGLCLGPATIRVSNGLATADPAAVAVGSDPVTITLDTRVFRCGVRAVGRDGMPVEAIDVTPLWPTAPKWTRSREEGVEWIEVGRGVRFDVLVRSADHCDAWIRDWRPSPGEVRTVVLDPWSMTTGVVLGPDDRPVPHPPLYVTAPDGSYIRGQDVSTWSDEFSVTNVPPGLPLRIVVHDGVSEVAVAEARSGDKNVQVRWRSDHGRLVLLRGSDDLRPILVQAFSDGQTFTGARWSDAACALTIPESVPTVDLALLECSPPHDVDRPTAGRAPSLTIVRAVPRRGLHVVWPDRDPDVTVTLAFRRADGAPPGPVRATLVHATGTAVSADTDRFTSIEFNLPGGETFKGTAEDLTGRWTATFELTTTGERPSLDVTLESVR